MADINLPDELILPQPESIKEQDLYKTLQDNQKGIVDSFSALADVQAITAGDGLTDTSNTFSVNTDGTTIETSGGNLKVVDGGILSTQLGDLSVTTGKIVDNAVTEDKFQLSNDAYIEAVDQASSGTVNLVKANTFDQLQFGTDIAFATGTNISSFSTDGTLAGDSDDTVPTEKAIKTYVDANASASKTETFLTTGADTWTAPTGVTLIYLTMIAGGGGGGMNGSAPTGGGSAGLLCLDMPVFVTAGQEYGLTIGTAGVGQASPGNGTDGGDTVFDTGAVDATITCAHGIGSVGGTATGSIAAVGSATDHDGNGVTGGTRFASGSFFILQGAGGDASGSQGGGGGATTFASAQTGGIGTGGSPDAAVTDYGVGGAGAGTNGDGGNGAPGLILISYNTVSAG